MAEHQHGGLGIALDSLGHSGDRAQGHRQQHVRTIRVVRAVHRDGYGQHVVTAFQFQLAALDRLTQLGLVLVQPGLGGLLVDLRYHRPLCLLLFTAERPPPTAGVVGLGVGLGHVFRDGLLHFLLGNLVRTEGPPARGAVLRAVLGVTGAAGNGGQAQGEC
ncbi:hypothetical protein D3C71_1564380 [compost metagenome]